MEPRTTCGMSSENIQDYLDGALTPAELARFEAHAAGCKACTRELEAYRGLFVRLSRMPLVAPAPDFDRAILAAVLPSRGRVLGLDPVGWFAGAYLLFTLGLLAAAFALLGVPAVSDPRLALVHLWSSALHGSLRMFERVGSALELIKPLQDFVVLIQGQIRELIGLVGPAAATTDGRMYVALSAATALAFLLFARRTPKGGPIVHACI